MAKKNSHLSIFSIFSQTVHTIRTKASQKEKDLSRLLHRICGSGFFKCPGFPTNHILTILWHHGNHTNFLTIILPWSTWNHIWSRVWLAWNHIWSRVWSPAIIYGPEYGQPGIINFCSKRVLQPKQKFSNIENRQLYRLRAMEPHLTFCICERYIAGQNSVKL